MVTVWWFAAHLIHYSCLIPAKPLHLRSMLSKSMRYTKNYDACGQHWSTQRAQFFSTVMPDHTSYNQHLKSWRNWATKFCLIHHIHLTSCRVITTSSSVWTTFCRENSSTISRMQKNAFQEFIQPQGIDFYTIGINKHFSLPKMCWF